MKEKKITIKLNGATQRQYSTILLELNLMKKAWKSYGVDINLSAPKLKAIINWGTKISEPFTMIDKAANDYNRTKDPKYKELWYKLIRQWSNVSLRNPPKRKVHSN